MHVNDGLESQGVELDGWGLGGGGPNEPWGIKPSLSVPVTIVASRHNKVASEQSNRLQNVTRVQQLLTRCWNAFIRLFVPSPTRFLLGQRLFGNAQRSVDPLKTVVTASLRTISSGKQIIPVSLFEMLQWAKI